MTTEQLKVSTRLLATKVMGCAVIRYGYAHAPFPEDKPILWEYADGFYFHLPNGTHCRFDPFTSRDDAHELRGRVTSEKKWDIVRRLRNITDPHHDDGFGLSEGIEDSWGCGWALLTATPAQITEAVWQAVQG